LGKTSFVCPRQEVSTGVGLPPVGRDNRPIRREPLVETIVMGMPGHRFVVGIAGSHDTTLSAHTTHLTKSSDWVIEVLKHLVGMDDVERPIIEIEGVHIAHSKLKIGDVSWAVGGRQLDDRI
jgi:hypothetical protein